jgi:hypothetical protein
MVRYTLALRGEPVDAASEMTIEEREVDIFREAQLEENFLCEVNPKGQVREQVTTPVHAQMLFRSYMT